MEHWVRHHAGAVLWRLSFQSWPSAPWLDPEVLSVSAQVSGCNRRPRELQDVILRRYHPFLAHLPLVRSSGSLEPLAPDLGWRLKAFARRGRERMRGDWREVQTQARARDPDALRAFLPPPDRSLALDQPVTGGFGRKALLGLMLAAADD
jgi:hypothetical protein